MANSDPTPLSIQPGLLKTTTDAAAGPRYVDGYHVRFYNGRPEKMLGFVKYITEQTVGVVHGAYAWVTTAGNRLLALGDYLKAYSVLDALDDITPLRDSGTLGSNPFAVVGGDATVTVADVTHGLEAGARVHFSGATAGGNITVDGEYEVATVVDADHYTIEHSAPALTGNDAYTKVLLHMNGSDASTTFTDSNAGGSAHTWTAAGNAQIDTADSKFDGASGLFDGTGDYISTPDHADFALGSGPFTIDLWFKVSASMPDGSFYGIASKTSGSGGAAANTEWYIARRTTNKIDFVVSNGTAIVTLSSLANYTASVNTGWHHLAAVVSGGTAYLFIDGVQQASGAFSGSVQDTAFTLYVGGVSTASWFGWIDEFRLSVGVARWTSNFTPPTTPYIADGSVGGSAVDYEYEINPGLADTVLGLGVGVGPVGEGTVGTPRTSGGILREMRTWFFDNYGTLLLVHPSGGTLYLWDEPSADDRAEAISGAPSSARASFVTAEGMIVALGTTTPMTLQWSDRDDPTNWTPSETTTANIRTVRTGNKLVAGTRFPGDGGQAFWSDTAFYGMQFIDSSSFIYETTVLAYDAGLIAPSAFELTRDVIIWLTPSLELMYYSGNVSMAPRWDEISEYFKSRINTDRADKLTFGHIPAKNTVVCHYTSNDSVDSENDEFFEVNLTDWSYTCGPRLPADKVVMRSAQVHIQTAGGAVIATGVDRYIYQHEVGVDADGASLPWSLRTGRLTIMEGAVDSDVNGYIPDCERQVGDIAMSVRIFERPNSAAPIDEQTFTFAPGTEIVDMVAGGRYADFEWSGEGIGSDFRFGKPLLDVAAAGRSR